jgi:glycosyltransferase involved in cell wall biosynthesis
MRVGILFGDFPPGTGGAHTFVDDVLENLPEIATRSKHDFVIMCYRAAYENIKPKISLPNVNVVAVAPPSALGKWIVKLKYASLLFRLLWRWPGTIEHTARLHDIQLLWFVGVDVYDSPDIPYIATVWDLQHRLQPFFPEVSAGKIWDKRNAIVGYFLQRAAYCVTGTEVGKKELEHFYQVAADRIRVIPLATPRAILKAPTSSINLRLRFGLDRDYLFYPAQFWPHKNHANLVLALKWLKELHHIEPLLVLSGADKGNLSFVQRFSAQEGMADQIRYLGFVSTEELVALYRSARALVFVSYFGPDNLPPLEAMALGCPVVASEVEGAREQYRDAVAYANPSDPQDIGKAILAVISDAAVHKRLVGAGFERARRWTASQYLREIGLLFDEFAAVRRNWP